jgi:hypothetical protein
MNANRMKMRIIFVSVVGFMFFFVGWGEIFCFDIIM